MTAPSTTISLPLRSRSGGGIRLTTVLRAGVILALTLLVVAGLLGPAIAPYRYDAVRLGASLTPPQGLSGHLLGTDELGRDLLSRILVGMRSSIGVGLIAVLISGVIGTTVGMAAGLSRGVTEAALMRIVDLQLSVPPIVLIIFLAFLIGPGFKTTAIILGIVGWLTYARLVRAEVLIVNEQLYILAARAVGCSQLRIALRHALPQVIGSIVVLATLQFGAAIILEASVSFLGFGIQPPGSSLGLLISQGKPHMSGAWWLPIFPCLVVFVLVLLINFFGDELEAILEPTNRNRGRG